MSISTLRLAMIGLASALVFTVTGPRVMAQQQTANLSDGQRRCLAEASRVKRDYIKYFGGDHVFYDFGERSAEAKALCENDDVDEAWDLIAEIKSDIRALRKQDDGRLETN